MTTIDMNTGENTSAPEYLLMLGIASATNDEPDLVAAHKWFNIAAMQGNHEAELQRHEVAQEMSPHQIASAQRAAREWLRVH